MSAAILVLPILGILLSGTQIRHRRFSIAGVVIAGIYAVAIATAALAHDGYGQALFPTVQPAAMAVVFALVGALLDRAERVAVARVVLAMALAQVPLAIAQAVLANEWSRQLAVSEGAYGYNVNLIVPGISRAMGVMGHPILFGLVCAIAVAFAMDRTVVRSHWVRSAIVVLLVGGIALSGSRSSLAAMGVGILVYLFHPGSGSRVVVRRMAVVVMIPVMWLYISQSISAAGTASPFSLTNRLDAWPRFVDALSRGGITMWLGEGAGFSLDTVADNQFLTTIGMYGFVGLIALGLVLAFGLWSNNPVISGAMAMLCFMALSFDVLEWTFSAVMIWLLVGASRPPSRVSDVRAPVAAHRQSSQAFRT